MLVAVASLTYLQAIVVGIVQGITELFPISSLGHSVLLPELLGWDKLVSGQAADESLTLITPMRRRMLVVISTP